MVLFAGTHEILNAAPSTPFHAVDVTEEGDVVGDVGDVEVREAFVAEEVNVGGGYLTGREGELLSVGEERLGEGRCATPSRSLGCERRLPG